MEEEEVHSEMGSIPQLEEHIEGNVETIEEGSIPPYNPPLTNMDIHVLLDTLLPHTQYQRIVPHIQETNLDFETFPPLTQNVTPSVENFDLDTQQTGLPTNYRTLGESIGFDRPLADLIQFGRVDLNAPTTTPSHPIVP